jgi:hypothetical protein
VQQIRRPSKLSGALAAVAIMTGGGAWLNGQVAQPPDVNGFKFGDTVEISTAFGWQDAKIIAIQSNTYRVRPQTGAEVTRTYPSQLHRIGPATARDKAVGLYEAHDRVEVNFEGRWVDGEVLRSMGMEYQVTIPGNRLTWAKPEDLRYVGPPGKRAAAPPGTPPRPGVTSCAGKIEGLYASGDAFSGLAIIFRSGKATVTNLGTDDVLECWLDGGKMYLHSAGELADLDIPVDINDDGTLQTPFGAVTKKGN